MKIVKINFNDGMELFIPFDELDKFEASIADIQRLEGIEMTEEDYHKLPGVNVNQHTFMDMDS